MTWRFRHFHDGRVHLLSGDGSRVCYSPNTDDIAVPTILVPTCLRCIVMADAYDNNMRMGDIIKLAH